VNTNPFRRHLGVMLFALAAGAAQAQSPEGRSYTPGAFDAVEIGGSADVRLQQGGNDEVFVEGPEEVQKNVELRVRDGVLRIESSGGWKFWNSRRARFVVTLRQITRLTISGAGELHAPGPLKLGRLAVNISGAGLARLDQLQAEQLAFSASGSGDAELAGSVAELGISISGRSNVRAENLAARRARVSIAGIGDVKLWASDELSISVSGVGRVEYWGTPQVRRSSSGLATIVDRGPKN
jgi:hypothetical protein